MGVYFDCISGAILSKFCGNKLKMRPRLHFHQFEKVIKITLPPFALSRLERIFSKFAHNCDEGIPCRNGSWCRVNSAKCSTVFDRWHDEIAEKKDL